MSWGDVPDWAVKATESLMRALRGRDPYTYGHCKRVSENATSLAKAAGLNAYECLVVQYASVFHDLGKIALPDSILLKPGKLTPEENEQMKLHPIKSAEIVESLSFHPFFKDQIAGIKHHHEQADGLGYPDGLKGEEIPLISRIIMIADTFDAMTTTRPYRKGLSVERTYQELKIYAGKQFDPQLVKIFTDAHKTWKEPPEEITETFIQKHYRKSA